MRCYDRSSARPPRFSSVNSYEVPILGQARLVIRWDAGPALSFLSGMQARLKNPSTLWEGVGEVMRGSFRRNFEFGGRPSWEPLKPHTSAGKARFLAKKPRPPFSKSGKPLKRLLQMGRLGPSTILIRRGKLRDSWVQKGAEGHVEEVTGVGGNQRFFVGSSYSLTRSLSPMKSIRPYHVLTKKAVKARKQGQAVSARIPLARFHEEGAPGANLPARRNAIVQTEDLKLIQERAALWVLGGTL
jgi:phage gpG-like protein